MLDYEIDNVTLCLLLAIVATLLYERISKPSPLAHPLLLGKQAEVSAVRKEGESGVYRSFATGHGTPFIIRPANTLKTLRDIVQPDTGKAAGTQRNILDVPLTNEALRELIRLLPIGLKALFRSDPTQETGPILVLLPPSPSTALPLLLLALSTSSARPLIILPSPHLLISALKAEGAEHPQPSLVITHESIAEGVIEQVSEVLRDKCAVVVAGDVDKKLQGLANKAGKHGVKVGFWEDLWDAAEDQEDADPDVPDINSIHSYLYSTSPGRTAEVTSFTHLASFPRSPLANFTAGIAALLALFPADKRPSGARRDVIVSATPLTSPIGMTIALASIWSGASFRLMGSQEASWTSTSSAEEDLQAVADSPLSGRPSIIFGTAKHHETIVSALQEAHLRNPLAKFVSGSKLAELATGYVSRTGFWDRLVWGPLRNNTLQGIAGDKLRAMIVVGEAPYALQLGLGNFLISLPTSRISVTPFSAGPLTVSHFFDLQAPVPEPSTPYASLAGERARVGAPANNVELVLRGVADNVPDEKSPSAYKGFGAAPALCGSLHARGPALGAVPANKSDKEGWVDINRQAAVWTSGTISMSYTTP